LATLLYLSVSDANYYLNSAPLYLLPDGKNNANRVNKQIL